MTLCNVQFTHSIHSGVCKEERLSWDEICRMATHPITLKQGQESPLWSFYNMKGQRGEYGRLLGVADNVISVIAMQIDYDDGTTIDQFKSKFGEYAFLLYTSKSHSPSLHKFRVVMPLHQAIDNRIYSSKSSRAFLNEIFTGCDSTTFDAWRKQRIPHKTEHTIEYVSHINHGKLYEIDVNTFTELYHQDQAHITQRLSGAVYTDLTIDPFTSTLEEICHINQLNSLISNYTEELECINWDIRGGGEDIHYKTRKIIYSLRMHGMDEDSVFAYIMNHAPHKYQQEMYSMCYGGI